MRGWAGNWRESIEKVQIAESLGYEMVTTGESWAPSSLPWLTLLATHTERIQIGTSILNVYSRSAAAIAQEFAQLEMLSGGRMVCGLGSSGHRVIEHFHGVPFERPLRRIREYVEIIDMLLSGSKLEYEGEIFSMSRGFRIGYEPQREHVPIYIASITPRSIEQTGEIADGIFPIHWPADRFGSLRSQLAEGAKRSGRSGDDITIAPFTSVYVTKPENEEAQWLAARQPLFHYVNRMGDFYWNMLSKQGYSGEVSASRAAWARRDRDQAVLAISEKMVRDTAVIGPIESIAEQLEARSRSGADLQLIQMPAGSPKDVANALESYLS